MKKLLLLIPLILVLTACAGDNKNMEKNIRKPAVAGQFYPDNPSRLEFFVNRYLEEAEIPQAGAPENVRAVLAPHAGYDYSGPVAAYGYKFWQETYQSDGGKKAGTVILIGNSHTAHFDGVGVDNNDAWQTPLGEVEVDRELAAKLVNAEPIIKYNSAGHESEHSLEVQIPFLQAALGKDFKILPLLFGNMRTESDHLKLAKALADNMSDDDLIVISSDLSHYPSYKDANEIDPATLDKIVALDAPGLTGHIEEVTVRQVSGEDTLLCGIDAVKTIMELARLKGWTGKKIKYANSGDAWLDGQPADKNRVVGYGVAVFSDKAFWVAEEKEKVVLTGLVNDFTQEQKETLLRVARQTVLSFTRSGKIPEFDIKDERLNKREGAFVTLNLNGQLRGCIGQIIPSDKPLWQVVREMAVAASSEDTRFDPVSAKELPELEYEISVLSAPEKISDWKKIELGKHGVIVSSAINSGVFLPQVATETGWSLEEFLSHLCADKAGLRPDCYKDPETDIRVFTATVIK